MTAEKNYEYFNRISHENKTPEEQADEMIQYRKKHPREFGMPVGSTEEMRTAMIDWLNQDKPTGGGKDGE